VLTISLNTPLLSAAESQGNTSMGYGWLWSLLVDFFMLAVCVASAALSIAAQKQWKSYWRWSALFPLLILGIWVAIIIMSRLLDENTHRLWQLEIFAWAMFNLIYMQALMLAKRKLDKADNLST